MLRASSCNPLSRPSLVLPPFSSLSTSRPSPSRHHRRIARLRRRRDSGKHWPFDLKVADRKKAAESSEPKPQDPPPHTPTHPRPQFNCISIVNSPSLQRLHRATLHVGQNVANHSSGIPSVSRAAFALPRISRQATQDGRCLACQHFQPLQR